jgi:putative flippase GtrA
MPKGLNQFFVFSIIGAVGTAGHYATLITLVELLSQPAVLASTLGFVVGALINYILNYHITFQSDKPHRQALLQFLLIAVIGGMMNTALMYLGVELLQLYYIIAQILATGIVLVWNFLASKHWAFKTAT